ncbi:MAG TPA: glycosyltransferase family 4 protein [Nitrospira sp.]|nr:glycosyltransferase family 4 protein [Nitrospira sp.]
MKVAHLIWSFKAGGSETMLVDIANEQALSNDVAIFIGNTDVDEVVLKSLNERVKVELIGRPPASQNLWYIVKLIRALMAFDPDIVHAHQESFIKFLRLLSFHKVMTVHDTNQRLKNVQGYDAIFSISEAVRDDIQVKQPGIRSTVIPNGICFSAVKAKTSYGQLPFRIVQVGRLDHQIKGQDILLRALQSVSQLFEGRSIVIDFIGVGPSKEYLSILAEELGLAEQCRFVGGQSRKTIYEQLHTYDLLVQPSRYEGFGLTVVEAMAARVPVLVSNRQGPMEIIENGKHGYFFTAENHVDCGQKIVSIIKDSQKENFPEKLIAHAEYAKKQFDIANTAHQYLDAYARVISAKS